MVKYCENSAAEGAYPEDFDVFIIDIFSIWWYVFFVGFTLM